MRATILRGSRLAIRLLAWKEKLCSHPSITAFWKRRLHLRLHRRVLGQSSRQARCACTRAPGKLAKYGDVGN